MKAKRRWLSQLKKVDVLFVAGLVLTIHESLFYVGPERPSLLVLFAGMMGFPAVVRFDEYREERRSRKDGDQ